MTNQLKNQHGEMFGRAGRLQDDAARIHSVVSLDEAIPLLDPCRARQRSELDKDIANLNLEPVCLAVILNEGWDEEKVDRVEWVYRCWLQLQRDFPEEEFAPSHELDLFWHQHILNLGLYLEQCDALFGRPLLHFPFSGSLNRDDAAIQAARYQKSQRMLAELVVRVRTTQLSHAAPPHDQEKHHVR